MKGRRTLSGFVARAIAIPAIGIAAIVIQVSAAVLAAPDAATPARQANPAPNGEAIYRMRCAICHGDDGTAKPAFARKGAPNMNDPSWQKSKTDEALRQEISDGKPGTLMVAYKARLSPAEIDAVIAHIRTLTPPKQ